MHNKAIVATLGVIMNLYWSRNKIPEWKDIDKEKHREVDAIVS